MSAIATPTRPAGASAYPQHGSSTLERHVRALVVSAHLEVRQPLLRTLEALPADVIACSSRSQAEEVLAKQSVEIVFCDEHLPDGCYTDLIHANHWDHRIPRVVVTTRTGDWDLYLEAMRQGAFDVIRYPGYATDVELAVIRALHEESRTLSSDLAA